MLINRLAKPPYLLWMLDRNIFTDFFRHVMTLLFGNVLGDFYRDFNAIFLGDLNALFFADFLGDVVAMLFGYLETVLFWNLQTWKINYGWTWDRPWRKIDLPSWGPFCNALRAFSCTYNPCDNRSHARSILLHTSMSISLCKSSRNMCRTKNIYIYDILTKNKQCLGTFFS